MIVRHFIVNIAIVLIMLMFLLYKGLEWLFNRIYCWVLVYDSCDNKCIKHHTYQLDILKIKRTLLK